MRNEQPSKPSTGLEIKKVYDRNQSIVEVKRNVPTQPKRVRVRRPTLVCFCPICRIEVAAGDPYKIQLNGVFYHHDCTNKVPINFVVTKPHKAA